jgi:TonB family protein
MFQWDATTGRSGKRFWGLVAASVLLHAGLFFGGVGLDAFRAARDLSMFRWEDDERYGNRVKVARVTTAPLSYPSGFFAVKETPKEIARHEERPKPPPEPKAERERPKKAEQAKKPEPEKSSSAEETPKPEDATPAPAGDLKFGAIQGNAFRPHLKAAYAAYQNGQLPEGPFLVTVTCSVQPDGSLAGIKLVKSSGNEMIDETALNLFRELSEMRALGGLAGMSSLSLTLERGASSSTLSAVGFAKDEAQARGLAFNLGALKQLRTWTAKNADETALINSTEIVQAGNRLSVRCSLPNSRAGEMMKRSFGSQTTAAAPPAAPSA